jgi:hypothetical protein
MAIVVALHARHFEIAEWGFLLLLWLLFVAIICGFFVVVGFFVDRTWSLGIGVSFYFFPICKGAWA